MIGGLLLRFFLLNDGKAIVVVIVTDISFGSGAGADVCRGRESWRRRRGCRKRGCRREGTRVVGPVELLVDRVLSLGSSVTARGRRRRWSRRQEGGGW